MKRIVWPEHARLDIRRLDRSTAMRVFSALHRYAESGEGDVRRLEGSPRHLRLRVGDYRVIFRDEDVIRVVSVRHRSEAYR